MTQVNDTDLHPVLVRQLKSLAERDIDTLMDNYTDDATLLRFDGVAQGSGEVREALTAYLGLKPELVELTGYNATDDMIFYTAVMNLGGQRENAFGTLVVRDGKIWRQTAGFGN